MSIQGDPQGTWPTFQPGSAYTLKSLYDIDPTVLGDLMAFIEMNPPKIPISMITGFSQIIPNVAPRIAAEETWTGASGTYGDLATVGPLLTGLQAGLYVVGWGCTASTTDSTTQAKMAISLNGATADDGNKAHVRTTAGSGCSSWTTYTLPAGTSGGNSLQAQYGKGGQVSATFGGRWLIAIRITGA